METIHYYATHQSKDNTQEYNFYCETEKIGSATTVVTDTHYNIVIRCNGLFLEHKNERDMEYVKKMRRYCVWSELDHREYTIYDADGKEVYAKLLWGDDPNKMVFTLQSPFGEYVVAITDGILAFVKNNYVVSGISDVQKDSPFALTQQLFKDPDWELCMAMHAEEKLSDELAVLMMGLRLILWRE